eukprot:6201738-Pleurochrysis_carterae.AAC.2
MPLVGGADLIGTASGDSTDLRFDRPYRKSPPGLLKRRRNAALRGATDDSAADSGADVWIWCSASVSDGCTVHVNSSANHHADLIEVLFAGYVCSMLGLLAAIYYYSFKSTRLQVRGIHVNARVNMCELSGCLYVCFAMRAQCCLAYSHTCLTP